MKTGLTSKTTFLIGDSLSKNLIDISPTLKHLKKRSEAERKKPWRNQTLNRLELKLVN